MLPQGPILVPLDGSQLSERSLPYATALGQALQRPLVLMIAAYVPDIPEHGPWSDEMVSHPRETCMSYLMSVAHRAGVPRGELIVRVGTPTRRSSKRPASWTRLSSSRRRTGGPGSLAGCTAPRPATWCIRRMCCS